MEDFRHSELLRGFQHRARVHIEALGVVAVVAGRRLVETIAIIEVRVIDKVKLHPIAGAAFEHRAEAVLVVERDGDAGDQSLRIRELGLTIARQEDVDFVSQSGERARQSADHVGESAGLRERDALRRREGDAHKEKSLDAQQCKGQMPSVSSTVTITAVQQTIEKATRPLVGKSCWYLGRAVNMAMFGFGEWRKTTSRKGGMVDVTEYALHVQCHWRILAG